MGSKSGKPISKAAEYESDKSDFIYKEMKNRSVVSSIEKEYKFIQKIGEGTYAEVFKAQEIKTGLFKAIKKVNKTKMASIQRILDHPNIIKMHALLEDNKFFYIVTQLIKGKDLFDVFSEKKNFTQKEVFPIFYQALLAINYLHLNNIMHRDIKLQNMIYDEPTETLKIIDFGSALVFEGRNATERRCTGTVSYLAPQVIKKFYNMKCDNWSLGVFLYILLSGSAPYGGNDNTEVMKNIVNMPISFQKPIWNKISEPCKQLITSLLQKDFEKRIQLQAVLKNNWLQKQKGARAFNQQDQSLIISSFTFLKKFKDIKIAQIQLGILVFMMNFIISVEKQYQMYKCFHNIDELGDGVINEDQLKQAMIEYADIPLAKATSEASAIMKKIDFNHSNDISFSCIWVGIQNFWWQQPIQGQFSLMRIQKKHLTLQIPIIVEHFQLNN